MFKLVIFFAAFQLIFAQKSEIRELKYLYMKMYSTFDQ